jgi:hypothetical protein
MSPIRAIQNFSKQARTPAIQRLLPPAALPLNHNLARLIISHNLGSFSCLAPITPPLLFKVFSPLQENTNTSVFFSAETCELYAQNSIF